MPTQESSTKLCEKCQSEQFKTVLRNASSLHHDIKVQYEIYPHGTVGEIEDRSSTCDSCALIMSVINERLNSVFKSPELLSEKTKGTCTSYKELKCELIVSFVQGTIYEHVDETTEWRVGDTVPMPIRKISIRVTGRIQEIQPQPISITPRMAMRMRGGGNLRSALLAAKQTKTAPMVAQTIPSAIFVSSEDPLMEGPYKDMFTLETLNKLQPWGRVRPLERDIDLLKS